MTEITEVKNPRLNQFLAARTGVSRRDADVWITEGSVTYNGNPGKLFDRVSEDDLVAYKKDGKWVELDPVIEGKTILMFKPIFTVTTRKDPEGRKTIYDRIPSAFRDLKPAGRLDYMSEGLLVMSSDGDLIQELTHPKFEHEKVYLVGTINPIPDNVFTMFTNGFELEGVHLNPVGVRQLRENNAEFNYLKLQSNLNWYKFSLTEGRNNQIRKMCWAFDIRVQRLIRIQQGPYKLTKELFFAKFIEAEAV